GLNRWTWIFSHILADQKFMTLFSLLFGASILLITDKLEQKGSSGIAVHYKRNFWLLVIGLLHAYLVWYGDILAPYAFCAFLVYPFRRLSIKSLMVLGLVFFSISSFLEIISGVPLLNAPVEVIQNISGGWAPKAMYIQGEIKAYQGGFLSQTVQRMHTAKMMQTTYFIGHIFWRVFGLMLMGMSLFKSGFLTGKWENHKYIKLLIWIGTPSFVLVASGVLFNFSHNWELRYSMFLGSQFNYWGSFGMAIAYASIVALICKGNAVRWVINRLAAVGRMALTNYLLQSLIMAGIFYGFGLFGKLERSHQLVVVLFIWTTQLLYSPVWLKHFNYGPFEWIWRSLTQGKIEAFRKS
ncbi:MAG: DUF418 domain-containing protein, partial [Bacteroidota bacterium]